MDRKLIFLAVMSVALVFLAVTAATAHPWTSPNTPLYTLRMEKASSEMNFSPAKGNGFAYTVEKGHTISYDVAEFYSDAELLATCKPSCVYSCTDTCGGTCNSSCGETCPQTCVNTCDSTCVNTCDSTCVNTCPQTCVSTCDASCNGTCDYTCADTCWGTCKETCEYSCEDPP
jgi:hypothetical protein